MFEALYQLLDIKWRTFNAWLDLRKENPGKRCGVTYSKEHDGFVEWVETRYGPGEREAAQRELIKQQDWARRLWTPEQHEQERKRVEKRRAITESLLKK